MIDPAGARQEDWGGAGRQGRGRKTGAGQEDGGGAGRRGRGGQPGARGGAGMYRMNRGVDEAVRGVEHLPDTASYTPPSSAVANTQGRESGGSWFETCSGVWYPRRRPCGVAINTLLDLINWPGKPQVYMAMVASCSSLLRKSFRVRRSRRIRNAPRRHAPLSRVRKHPSRRGLAHTRRWCGGASWALGRLPIKYIRDAGAAALCSQGCPERRVCMRCVRLPARAGPSLSARLCCPRGGV